MERMLDSEPLKQIFEEQAENQYTKKLLFSDVVGLMRLVVCGVHPSVGAAYKALNDVLDVSSVALYAKINGLEPK